MERSTLGERTTVEFGSAAKGRAVGNPGLEQFHFRRPWHLLGFIVLAAVLGTALVVVAVRARIADDVAQADKIQRLRPGELASRSDAFVADSIQLLNATVAGPCSLRGDVVAIRSMTLRMLRSRLNPRVFGLGCFFEPGVFDPKFARFGPYVSSQAGNPTFQTNERGYPYERLAWYRAAVAGAGKAIPYGPYSDAGVLFISFLKAFYDGDGRLAGVASVDSPLRMLRSLGVGILAPDDYAFSERRGIKTIAVGVPPRPTADLKEMSLPIAFTGGHLHLIASRAAINARNRGTLLNGVVAISVIWLVAFLMALMLVRSWRGKRRNIALNIQQLALENELTVRAEVEAHLRHAAYTDLLTGLPNRASIVESLGVNLAQPDLERGLLILIDVDGFSMINDTLGRESGDSILMTLSKRLTTAFDHAVVARGSGDEFFVSIWSRIIDLQGCAQRIGDIFATPVNVQERPIHLSASLGAVWVGPEYTRGEDILKDAEIAMYRSKAEVRGGLTVFEPDMRRRLELDALLEHDLRSAIQNDEFTVFYQPIIELATRSIVSLEALVRWNRPGEGLTNPIEFIPFAETHGMVSAIDALVMQHVCEQMHGILALAPDLSIAVNCSIAQLTSSDIVDFTLRSLQRHSIHPSHLKLEITETSIMRNAEFALQSLEELRAAGVLTVVDDFGTGYSSLSYLQRLPIAGMKIDRSFVTPLEHSSQAKAIVRSIIALAETLGLYTVAEGVETAAQLAILEQLGATHAQGFFFSRPVDGASIRELLTKARFSEAS